MEISVTYRNSELRDNPLLFSKYSLCMSPPSEDILALMRKIGCHKICEKDYDICIYIYICIYIFLYLHIRYMKTSSSKVLVSLFEVKILPGVLSPSVIWRSRCTCRGDR